MELDIRGIHIPLTDGLKTHIEDKFNHALGRFDRRIKDVTIRLEELNGPKGGVDKFCKVHAHIVPTEHLIIEEKDVDLYVAIDRAASRLKQVMSRKADKLPKSHHRETRTAAK